MKEKKSKKKAASKKQSYFKGVKSELKRVKWPAKKEVVKYTIATIVFVVVFVVLFLCLTALMAFLERTIG